MKAVQLKTSCDSCRASKVKCSGGERCERCVAKGIACFYSPRKKRGPPKKRVRMKNEREDLLAMKTENIADPANALGALGLHERRSWSVFFTLYKHYNTSCSRFWFNRQLNKMRHYLEKQENKDALKRLTSWMEALSIDVDDLEIQLKKCLLSVKTQALENTRRLAQTRGYMNGPNLHIKGELRELQMNEESEMQQLLAGISHKGQDLPFLKVVTGLDNAVEESSVEVNDAFTNMFGYTSENIEAQLKWTGGGFLPWGGDVLSRILTNEKDLLSFVQILAIKFNGLGRPEHLPIVREVPSAHNFPVSMLPNPAVPGSVGRTVKTMIKCVHREILAFDRSYMEMLFTFQPLVNQVAGEPKSLALPKNVGVISTKLTSMLPQNLDAKTDTFNVEHHQDQHITGRKRQPVLDDANLDMLDLNNNMLDDLIQGDANPLLNSNKVKMARSDDIPVNDAAFGDLPLEDSGSDQDLTEEADFFEGDEIDGQWLDNLLDWVKAE